MSFADSTGLSICHIHSPNIILLGSSWVWVFYLFRLFTHRTYSPLPSAYLLQLFIVYLLSTEKGDFLKAFVFDWSVSATGKPRPLGSKSVSILFWGPFTGQSPGSESGSSALGRVTQSGHQRPLSQVSSVECVTHCRQLLVPLKGSH